MSPPGPPEAPGRPPGRRAGRRALFSDPDGPASGAERSGSAAAEPGGGVGGTGRRAFFSDAGSGRPPDAPAHVVRPDGTDPGDGLGALLVVCRTCLARTPVSVVSLGVALLPSLWLPTRRWSRLMRCPACHRVSWCRVERVAPGGG